MRLHPEPHCLVPRAAELGADAPVDPRLIGLQANYVAVARNGIDLSAKSRHPKGVDHVGAGHRYVDRLARRDVQRLAYREPRHVGIGEAPRPLFCPRLGTIGDLSPWQELLPQNERCPCQQHEYGDGQDQSASHDPLARRHPGQAVGPKVSHCQKRQNQGRQHCCAGKHDPPQERKVSRSRPCRIERGKLSGATGQQDRRCQDDS